MTMALAENPRGMQALQVLRESSPTRPEVRLVGIGSRLAVVKDFGGGNGILRAMGRALIPREREAYQRLAGLPGVPRWLGQPNPYSMATEYLEGVPLPETDPGACTATFCARLQALIRAMHGRGVVHCDLKCLENILVTPDGWPAIVDFSSAVFNGSNPAVALLMPHLMDEDVRAVYKAKLWQAPHLLSDEEAVFLSAMPVGKRVVRCLVGCIRNAVKNVANREHNRQE